MLQGTSSAVILRKNEHDYEYDQGRGSRRGERGGKRKGSTGDRGASRVPPIRSSFCEGNGITSGITATCSREIFLSSPTKKQLLKQLLSQVTGNHRIELVKEGIETCLCLF